ncbi:hypothetical protein GW756_04900 [bacterium]|nr:hypothetical protein [bacterium]NCQ55716.1 hypothetical protein [Candidatus Parcubacteria bacterium]NCS67665.1 hypothetical protein [Candidatus Peregrinibacteria bacterium]NCS96679.1 hypothetical protein [bacterium]
MHQQVQQWVKVSANLKKNLEIWVEANQQLDVEKITELYHPKARVFPAYGSLKVGHAEIKEAISKIRLEKLTLNYGSLSYNTDENIVEGEYEYQLQHGEVRNVNFAMKFDSKNLIVEHASAPVKAGKWKLKNEVSICTLLTAATVQSVLKKSENTTSFMNFTQKLKPKK